MQKPESEIGFGQRLANRLYPVSLVIGIVISVGMPTTYYILQSNALRRTADIYALDFSEELRLLVQRDPEIWKERTEEYTRILHHYLPHKGVVRIRVLDETGEPITAYGYITGESGAWWTLHDVVGSAPIVFEKRKVGTVEVSVSQGTLLGMSLALFLLSALMGTSLAVLVYRFPVRVVTGMEGQVKEVMERHQRSAEEQQALREFLSNLLVLDLDDLLRRFTEQAVSLFKAEFAWVRLLDEEGRIKTRAVAGEESVVRLMPVMEEGQLVGRGRWMLDHRRALTVKDMALDPDRPYHGAVQAADLHGFLGAPLFGKGGKPLGVIFIMTRPPRAFSQHEVDLIEQFANGAAIAIENADLYKVAQRQEEIQRLLKELSQEITTLDIDSLLRKLTEKVRDLLGVDVADVRILEGKEWHFRGVSGIHAGAVPSTQIGEPRGRSNWILKHRSALVIPDIEKGEEIATGETLKSLGIRGYLGVPIFSRGGEVVGVLRALTFQPRKFRQDEVDLLQQLANGAAVAIENFRLFEEIQKKSRDLEEAYETKSDFFNMMAHQLRTPLHVVLGTQQLLADGLYGKLDEDAKQGLETIRANVHSLLGLISEILELARIEARKLPVQIEEFDLKEITDELDSSFVPLGREKGIVFRVNRDARVSLLKSDKSKLKEVLRNLVANAVKYTDKGEVELQVSYLPTGRDEGEQGRVAFAVRDTGLGIKKEDLPHLFEPFYLGAGVDRRKYPGTGLGLSIVKRLVELLQGEIHVESEWGRGSTFTVVLPLVYPGPA